METSIRYNDRAAYAIVAASVVDMIFAHGTVRQKDRAEWEYQTSKMLAQCCGLDQSVEWLKFSICVGLNRDFPLAVTPAVVAAARSELHAARAA
ncbi:MAG: hypothetical protein NW217_12855 [Hyphomicrobiaceae bacterium]|nr:hypothetical protein [Hyphomicrobiaceae bacterium]